MNLSEAISVREVATKCRVSQPTVYRWITSGVIVGDRRVRLAAVRVGGQYQITPEVLDEFVRNCNPTPPPEPQSLTPG